MRLPSGKPIPGVTNEEDVEWALTKARRYVFNGGSKDDPRYEDYINSWLDYLNELHSVPLMR